jgi:hypothetical protein
MATSFSGGRSWREPPTIGKKLQDEIKTDKIELNKFHASKKYPFY